MWLESFPEVETLDIASQFHTEHSLPVPPVPMTRIAKAKHVSSVHVRINVEWKALVEPMNHAVRSAVTPTESCSALAPSIPAMPISLFIKNFSNCARLSKENS